jgi:internalin A
MRKAGWWLGLVLLLTLAPGVRSQHSPEQRVRALEAIKAAGGRVVTEGSGPEAPVIRIELNGPKVTDATLAYVRGFLYVRTLYLCRTRITDAGLAYLQDLKDLEILYLSYDNIGDRGLEQLQRLSNLEVLGLSYTNIDNAALTRMSSFRKLQTLALSGTNVSDTGLAFLRKLTKLQELYLDGTGITKAGLVHLKDLPLETLSYSGTKAVEKGVEGFHKKLTP